MNAGKMAKAFWIFMVFLGFTLLLLGFFTGDIMMWLVALAIGILVRYCAYDLLFAKYDQKIAQVRQKYAQRKDGGPS
ncbi:hypothetical protein NIE88_21745 [Sporolactobacillus shoreicorticis]|uniref:DUF2273 domain-containing protein n=1 Tax=Sporolactobacillus shoreicorticis TaxID=1923877 RepID=A0ABW5S8H7_9BACL|nr:hypothetical protein [Sporolactobacillus shoreicorticis]MCO7128349.1 hypothetical protein [Sporolactobacillus shoreicorticis]